MDENLLSFLKKLVLVASAMALLGVLAVVGVYLYIAPTLPDVETLKDVKFQVPLRVYSADGVQIGEFGEMRRTPLKYDEIPEAMIQAVLGAEDDRFFTHPGVDYQGLFRAVGKFVTTGEKAQGGSTITMQVARNFFLSSEKTFFRKFSEILLALRIEGELTKKEILELYLNKIYFGKRAYGVAAAAQTYFGKELKDLTVAQVAMIAGLPKAPSSYNPIVNPKRALIRRNYVLRRMLDLSFITEDNYRKAVLEDITASLHGQGIDVEAPYVSEMARKQVVEQFGENVYTEGYKIYTTVNSRLQQEANLALRKSLLDYESRHGYRGALKRLDRLNAATPDVWDDELEQISPVPVLQPGVVIDVDDENAYVYLLGNRIIAVCWNGLKWAAPYVDGTSVGAAPQKPADVVRAGDVIHVYRTAKMGWVLGQVPEVEGAIVSLRARDGGVLAMVGGFDFYRSNFNRVDQAKRQPGSSFKPFVYSAALEKGFTAATLINDAPVVFDDPGLEDTWKPENYTGEFFGPTRLREALVNSRNLVSIRILRSIGISYAIDYAKRFGFDAADLPKDLSLALGSANVTPLSIVKGYAIFANGGYRVEPYLITRIEKANGEIVYRANPATVCEACEEEASSETTAPITTGTQGAINRGKSAPKNVAPRVITPQNAYIMNSIMRDIVQRGTGRRARVLGRSDLAGKTGTTNDQRDVWFSGFNREIVTTTWMGFDKPIPLGHNESGAQSALPMWINYMGEALKGVPDEPMEQPPGIVSVRIDPKTGLLADSRLPSALFEIFTSETVPSATTDSGAARMQDGDGAPGGGGASIPEQLF